MDPYQAHPVFDDKDVDAEPVDIPEEEDKELNNFIVSQVVLTGLEDDPTHEFEIGQQFENKEEVMMVIKMYSIRKVVEYKIFESDQFKYVLHCTQFGSGCQWNIRILYH
ncbi:hypothetical protein Ahy_A07g034883 [Arachis hypogaea]|uniref:Transposase MuDR plant domain-containing protein n=1 Tax=Arachis hypogaea TaxID=3818 RepID=A0A445CCY5_ARAHY|nr:hypothetical protein Ahy_A07g034883 [Arachis hypogaea]